MLFPSAVFIAMGAWGVLHSWMAAFSTKELARKTFGQRVDRYYRLIFVGLAVMTLLPILAMIALLPARLLWVIPAPWRYLTLGLQFLALVGLLITIFHTDVLAFAGIKQLSDPQVEKRNSLVRGGIYRVVRHPMYFFSLIIFWLFPIVTDLLLAFFAASTLYFVIGTIPEEQKMVKIYGEEYERYQAEVPRIIPGIKP